MKDTMSYRTWRIVSSPLFLAVTMVAFGLFAVFVLRPQAALMAAHTPPGAEFDTSFFYTPASALERAAAYTTEGRFVSIAAHWGFDLVFPMVYGLFIFAAWAFSLERLFQGSPLARRAAAATFLGPAFDYAENICVTMLMANEPVNRLGWAIAASGATALKWLFVVSGAAGSALLLLFFCLRGIRKTRAKRS